VGELSVRRPWRKVGLGLALLHHAFGEFYRRGEHNVRLNADSQNLTGAIRLYTRAGMHQIRQNNQYQKELRPGIELSNEG
jgi:mycothiol synthase